MTFSCYLLSEKPEYRPLIDQLSDEPWPGFLLNGDVHHWYLLFEVFPAYQILFIDDAGGLIAAGHTVPIVWDGSISDLPQTIEAILVRAEQSRQQNQKVNTLTAVAAMVSSNQRGQGLSSHLILEMKNLARRHACTSLIAPVRPTWKSRYPLTPMEHYVKWTRADGAPLDPWIRVHWHLGAQPLEIAPNTLTVEGNIQQWEEWTGMIFPETGLYVVPGALQPVHIDCEKNTGRYEDPNYWMKHTVE